MKWISHSTTEQLVNQLIAEVNKPSSLLQAPPSPIFISKIQTNQYSPKGQTPPRSPSGEKFLGKTMSPQQTALLETRPSATLHGGGDDNHLHPESYGSPNGHLNNFDRFSRTDTDAMANIVKNHPINRTRTVQQQQQ